MDMNSMWAVWLSPTKLVPVAADVADNDKDDDATQFSE